MMCVYASGNPYETNPHIPKYIFLQFFLPCYGNPGRSVVTFQFDNYDRRESIDIFFITRSIFSFFCELKRHKILLRFGKISSKLKNSTNFHFVVFNNNNNVQIIGKTTTIFRKKTYKTTSTS